MKKDKLPFETTPQILRYLGTMLNFENQFFGQTTGDFLFINTYAKGEDVNLKSELNYKSFWSYMSQTGAIEYSTERLKHGGTMDGWKLVKFVFIEGQRATLGYPIQQKIRILDISKIKELFSQVNKSTAESIRETNISIEYKILLKDREIWVNNYLLSRPHATGINMEFFQYLFENPNKLIKKSDFPDYVKKEIGTKKISKMLNGLGFKGEILKAFFPKSGKMSLMFRPTIFRKDFEKRGIKENIFLKELDLAHSKKSSK